MSDQETRLNALEEWRKQLDSDIETWRTRFEGGLPWYFPEGVAIVKVESYDPETKEYTGYSVDKDGNMKPYSTRSVVFQIPNETIPGSAIGKTYVTETDYSGGRLAISEVGARYPSVDVLCPTTTVNALSKQSSAGPAPPYSYEVIGYGKVGKQWTFVAPGQSIRKRWRGWAKFDFGASMRGATVTLAISLQTIQKSWNAAKEWNYIRNEALNVFLLATNIGTLTANETTWNALVNYSDYHVADWARFQPGGKVTFVFSNVVLDENGTCEIGIGDVGSSESTDYDPLSYFTFTACAVAYRTNCSKCLDEVFDGMDSAYDEVFEADPFMGAVPYGDGTRFRSRPVADILVAAVGAGTRGSIIVGNSAGAWAAYGKQAAGKILRYNATDLVASTSTFADTYAKGSIPYASLANTITELPLSVPAATFRNVIGVSNGEDLPSWKALFDATVPTTIAEDAVADTGTSELAARRDHTHGAPATWTPSAHTHAAEDITSGTLAIARGGTGADGSNLAASRFLASPVTGGAASYRAIAAADIPDISATYALTEHDHAGVYEPVLGNPAVTGYVLASTDTGVRSWVAGGMANPMTTLGDIIYGGTAGAATRLGGNTVAKSAILSSTGTGTAAQAPAWSEFYLSGTAGGATSLNVTNGKTLTLTCTDDFNLTIPATGTAALLERTNVFTALQQISYNHPDPFTVYGTLAASRIRVRVMNFAAEGYASFAAYGDTAFLACECFGSTYADTSMRNWGRIFVNGTIAAGLKIAVTGADKPIEFWNFGGGYNRKVASIAGTGLLSLPITGSGAGLSIGTATACTLYQTASAQLRTASSFQVDLGFGVGRSCTVTGVVDANVGYRVAGAAGRGKTIQGDGTNGVFKEPDFLLQQVFNRRN